MCSIFLSDPPMETIFLLNIWGRYKEFAKIMKKNYDNRAHVTHIFKIAKIANLKADYR